MSRILPGLGLTGFFGLGFDGWDTAHDADLRKLSAVCYGAVLSRVAAEPGAPVDGQMYLLTGTANINKIAVRDNSTWVYFDPWEGLALWVSDEDLVYRYDGAAWSAATVGPQPYITGTFFDASPTANEVLLDHVFPVAVSFSALFAGSVGSVLANPTLAFSMAIRHKVGAAAFVTIGSVDVSIGGVVSFTGSASFAVGDRLRIIAPATPDVTIAGLAVSLKGTR